MFVFVHERRAILARNRIGCRVDLAQKHRRKLATCWESCKPADMKHGLAEASTRRDGHESPKRVRNKPALGMKKWSPKLPFATVTIEPSRKSFCSILT
jgi:hypothetical protein